MTAASLAPASAAGAAPTPPALPAGTTGDTCSDTPLPSAVATPPKAISAAVGGGRSVGGGIDGHQNLQTDNLSDQSQPQPPTSSSSSNPAAAADRPPDHHSNGNDEPASTILTFAEIPSDIAQLNFNQQRLDVDSPSTSHPQKQSSSYSTPLKLPSSTTTPSHSPSLFSSLTHRDANNESARASDPSPAHSTPSPLIHFPQGRKPSPGLAARLRALGFGPKNSPPPPSAQHPDHVGRLPEDQIRQLDHNHQAGSIEPVIERRGRPWKGAGAVVARLPSSVAALATGRARHDVDTDADADSVDYLTADNIPDVMIVDEDTDLLEQRPPSRASSYLPEIETAPPLDMDTNKYILPDHTNGNGTKVQLGTLQLHLERDSGVVAYSPSSSDEVSPEIPPPPPPKDSPPPPPPHPQSYGHVHTPSSSSVSFTPDAASYFNPLGLQRPGSIYTLSRVSFANQLAQLTSLQLPDAESLSSKVSAIPTAQAAARALIGAAEQIRNWISKASEVIDGLDSDDDVEWAAAGGREGLEEVENAIVRFEELINVYVGAIEELQSRPDIASVTPEDLQQAVVQMESIMEEWRRMRTTLHSVKAQVEIAMEWEELWSMVLGDIQNEMDELSRLVFEMEERRHKSIMASGSGGDAGGVDIGDLETIVEETQQQNQHPPNNATTRVSTTSGNNRFSIPVFPTSPSSPDEEASTPSISQDDSSLLALFARMQPLRASLDFLPMRLSVFETRASSCFPTACEELEMRRAGLDASYRKLEKDAESLRKELGEDRWVTVFRGAARQAQKMYESVERSVGKLREALDTGMHLTNPPLMGKKIESYETKKMHYGPAVERVLAIIDRGVKDRLTLNGEIIRLHAELQAKWDDLKDRMRDVDLSLEDIHDDKRNQQLRDSISSMLSNDRSTIGSARDTPQSSPPSSVIMSSLGLESSSKRTTTGSTSADYQTTPTNNKRRTSVSSHLPQPATNRRTVSSPAMQPRKPPFNRYASSANASSGGVFSSPIRSGSVTPVSKRTSQSRPVSTMDMRPRWNSSTTGIDTGHNFKPLTLTTPSPYAKAPPIRRSASKNTPGSGSKLPTRSPLSRAASQSPAPGDTPSRSPLAAREMPYRPRLGSFNNRRVSMQPPRAESVAGMSARPASSMAMSRRTSLLPAARMKRDSSVNGRASPQAIAGARFAMRKNADEQKKDDRPRWRV